MVLTSSDRKGHGGAATRTPLHTVGLHNLSHAHAIANQNFVSLPLRFPSGVQTREKLVSPSFLTELRGLYRCCCRCEEIREKSAVLSNAGVRATLALCWLASHRSLELRLCLPFQLHGSVRGVLLTKESDSSFAESYRYFSPNRPHLENEDGD